MTLHPTPEELTAAKSALYRMNLGAVEHVARLRQGEELAEAAIRDYAKVYRTTPAIALLRIAATMCGEPDAELIRSVCGLLDVSDPEDFEAAVQSVHDAADAYDAMYGRD